MSKSVGISKLPDGKKVDYSLYLVTDSTPAILGDKDIVEVVEAALQGGVTIVQYRDKTSDTADLISTGKKLHAITQKYGVPLLINDRLDVAIAVGCQGVHIGQDDIGMRCVILVKRSVLLTTTRPFNSKGNPRPRCHNRSNCLIHPRSSSSMPERRKLSRHRNHVRNTNVRS